MTYYILKVAFQPKIAQWKVKALLYWIYLFISGVAWFYIIIIPFQQNRPQEHINKVMPSNVNHNHSSRHYQVNTIHLHCFCDDSPNINERKLMIVLLQVSPIPNDLQAYMNNLQPSRDLLQRPEAQAIVHG